MSFQSDKLFNEGISNSEFSRQLDKAIASAKTRLFLGTAVMVASIGLVSYYLSDAKRQFVETTPEFVANYAAGVAMERLPQTGTDVKARLIAYAPDAIATIEGRIEKLPGRFADEIKVRAEKEMKTFGPELETELTKTLREALRSAAASGVAGKGDEAGIKAFVDSLVTVYGQQANGLIDSVHAKYRQSGGDALAYLEFLAEGKDLDERQTLQRQALVAFLTTAARTRSATEGASVNGY